MSDLITIEKVNRVYRMGLNRTDKYNAFNLEMLEALARAYTEFDEDPQMWCALLFAHGENFTSGLDLAEVGPHVASGQPIFPDGSVDPFGLFGRARTKPVVVVVQGFCFTIGVELCLASDVRIAAEGTRFAQMEVRRGIMPFGGATLRLPQVAGWGNAMLHLLTGDEFDAGEALRIGLVQDVREGGDHLERGEQVAQAIARQAPLAVQATLGSSATCVRKGQEAALGNMMERATGLMGTEDAMEGVMSFMERREARFKGR